ncbi:MAG: ABC transporter substrate-binding protein [Gammaproteobacteria bacterium]|nr:ABC transporter substrate-binding protein [Gammaproteobacteria bacterium]
MEHGYGVARIHLMALRHSAFYSPFLLTVASGHLRAEGLEATYDLAASGQALAAALADGRCHVAQSAVATSFAALERGERIDVAHFAQINERDGFFLAGRRPEPGFTWDRLRGRRVLVDHFFQPLAMFRYGLWRMGVDVGALDVVDAGDVASIERAFRDGAGDYVHLQGPAPQQLEHEGIASVVAAVGDAVGPVAFSSLCADRAWLGSDMARAFMRAYRRARGQAIAAPAGEIAARLREAGFFPAIDPAVLAATVAAYQRLGCWTADPAISPAAYERLLDVFLHGGLITRRHPYEAAVAAPP